MADEKKTKAEDMVAVVSINDYIKAKERDGAVLVAVHHPAASDGDVFQGKYSGVRLFKGPFKAQYSDGTSTN